MSTLGRRAAHTQRDLGTLIDRQITLLADVDPGPAGLVKAAMVLAGIAGTAGPALVDLDDDVGSGPAACTVSGYPTAVAEHTLTALALDVAGNERTETVRYTVDPWTMTGFYAPVDMGGVVNTSTKGGFTVPLQFEVFAGPTEVTATSALTVSAVTATCDTQATTDEAEQLASGNTSLRYDAASGTFVYNWKTPKARGRVTR